VAFSVGWKFRVELCRTTRSSAAGAITSNVTPPGAGHRALEARVTEGREQPAEQGEYRDTAGVSGAADPFGARREVVRVRHVDPVSVPSVPVPGSAGRPPGTRGTRRPGLAARPVAPSARPRRGARLSPRPTPGW
jgi:hypothetical protein